MCLSQALPSLWRACLSCAKPLKNHKRTQTSDLWLRPLMCRVPQVERSDHSGRNNLKETIHVHRPALQGNYVDLGIASLED